MNILAIGGGDKFPAISRALEAAESADVLIIPTACSTEKSYNRKLPNCLTFFTELGAKSTVLHEFSELPTPTKIEHKIGAASLIYTIGGNTQTLIRKVDEMGLRAPLVEAVYSDTVLTGTSAGAILPFAIGQSCPAINPEAEEWEYVNIEALGIVDAAIGVHANKDDGSPSGPRGKARLSYFLSDFPTTVSRGYALDNGASIFVTDSNVSVIKADPAAKVVLVERNGQSLDVSQLY